MATLRVVCDIGPSGDEGAKVVGSQRVERTKRKRTACGVKTRTRNMNKNSCAICAVTGLLMTKLELSRREP